MFSSDRNETRQVFCKTWKKMQDNQILEPVEAVVAEVIAMHPEYHPLLTHSDSALQKDYMPHMGQTNPFLHMGLHIALLEQIATNRPKGIVAVYKKLLARFPQPHDTQHTMIECLAKSLHQAQSENKLPDEKPYLRCLKKIK
jgi:hypothetical protein